MEQTEPTASDGPISLRQAIFERLCQRNVIRRERGIRLINVKAVYKYKVKLMSEAHFNQILEPILAERFGAVDWPIGFTPRLLLAVKLHQQAVDQVRSEYGIVDPRSKKPNMLVMIDRLASGSSTTATVVAISDHMDET